MVVMIVIGIILVIEFALFLGMCWLGLMSLIHLGNQWEKWNRPIPPMPIPQTEFTAPESEVSANATDV